jgi:hypothetical protein
VLILATGDNRLPNTSDNEATPGVLWTLQASLGSGTALLSNDRLLQVLLYLAILLFVSAGVLPLGRSGYRWVRWARWGAIVIFSIAIVYALVLVLRWALVS